MKKIVSVLIAVTVFFALSGTATFAASAEVDGEKTYKCATIPEPMKPGSVVEYVDETHIKIVSGGFLSEDYKKYLTEPGMYPVPLKGLLVEYCDDGYIGKIRYPQGVDDPALKPLKTEGLKARASAKSNAITLTWTKNDSANGHRVYRSQKKDGVYTLVKTLRSGNTVRYNDKDLTPGKTYFYKLEPFAQAHGKTYFGPQTACAGARVRS